MFKASCCYSVLSNNDLVIFLDEYYSIKNIRSLYLHRAWIGDVYFFEDDKQSYVMKIYKSLPAHKRNAESSANVMEYLWEKGIHVPKVFKNINMLNTTTLLAPEGEREVVVTSFVEGESIASSNNEIQRMIGRQAAQMRSIMKKCPFLDSLKKINEDSFVDNFLKVMYEYFPHKETEVGFFEKYGELLSKNIKELYSEHPQCIGFCHGDFHGGNMIKAFGDAVTFFDFDACGIGCSLYDISVYCEKTNYFYLDKAKILETHKVLEAFLEGYSDILPLSQREIDSMPLFSALRHYELNATIPENRAPIEGRHWLNDQWIDKQYAWLKAWYEIYHAA